MGAWGGPKDRVRGILLGDPAGFMSLGLCVFLGRTPLVWAAGFLLSGWFGTVVNGLSQSLWQAKVPPQYQGRVFAARRMIAYTIIPLATLVAGPLADKVFEPAMRSRGMLSAVFGAVTGMGPGSGMAVMYLLSGVGASLVTLVGFARPQLRNLDRLLPDHGAGSATADGADDGQGGSHGTQAVSL